MLICGHAKQVGVVTTHLLREIPWLYPKVQRFYWISHPQSSFQWSSLGEKPHAKLLLRVYLCDRTLEFDRQDLSLEASYIFIFGREGALEVGTEDDPFEQNAVCHNLC